MKQWLEKRDKNGEKRITNIIAGIFGTIMIAGLIIGSTTHFAFWPFVK